MKGDSLILRKIICRFRNQEDVEAFNTLNNFAVSSKVTQYDLDTDVYKVKTARKSTRTSDDSWKELWKDLPNFYEPKVVDFAKVDFTTNNLSSEELSKIFNQKITDRTKSVWFPKLEQHTKRYFRVVGGDNPKYPIYVVSKGRYTPKRCLTVKWLNQMCVPHYVVVEPNEVADYEKMVADYDFKYTTVLELDMSYKNNYDTLDDRGDTIGKGPGGARNFCWDDSTRKGYKYHWVLDDNIDGFHYLTHNIKWKARTGACFSIAEEFFTRFENLSMGSLDYSKFVKESDHVPAYVMNTRMYSCIFIKNSIPYRWRGRYNEDTILSLDVLRHGGCTCQLNALLADKLTTQRIDGGNNEMFYEQEGTYNKSKMLVDVYPQYARMVHKFSRIHHHVDYSSFNQKLVYREGFEPTTAEDNQRGLKIVKIPVEWDGDVSKDNRFYIENHLDKCEDVDYNNY